MKVFLSYSHADLDTAEAIALSIRGAGKSVFFDKDSLQKGDEYDQRIRSEIHGCDLFVFLISPSSIRKGSYARAELKFARERWPHPSGRVLPVLIQPTPTAEVPAYLRSITFLEPEGNAAAEVTAEIDRLSTRTPRLPAAKPRTVVVGGMALISVLALSSSALFNAPWPLRSRLTPAPPPTEHVPDPASEETVVPTQRGSSRRSQELEQALAAVNIDFSDAKLAKQLGNPSSRYPQFAEGCLKLLSNQRLRNKVYFDVIFWNYTEERKAKVNGDAADGELHTTTLKAAMLEAYQSRHGGNPLSFADIVAAK